ncbi:hypothetical protein MBM_03315 [Drepanopeziza brunnea f. sp. 'multigermtubi' MB_m1]|uniref:Uncharacterized protein n=1 Tax=Marssonina brunnea f. sp. multigermtubi (strain MB_m1) TaxID=1072389 RepID=K1X030_MARBU|nr:uncharacterized protein MBM_03315 [Drepanopeziza brunnea f. sp. 'multigermtubi' MB_m1]EKD18322.1 hypothetical protein MBM_03315 [Drepanopeziza brunnea f. sp. 'multigermtubi' MB_m1]
MPQGGSWMRNKNNNTYARLLASRTTTLIETSKRRQRPYDDTRGFTTLRRIYSKSAKASRALGEIPGTHTTVIGKGLDRNERQYASTAAVFLKSRLLMAMSGSRRQKGPLVITAIGAGALFIGLKWKAVLARSEAAKKTSTKENYNYSVAPGRSGKSSIRHSNIRISIG